ncbi:hypothetical protein E1N66_22290 [Pantoea allii]|nr:hypothetical protein E1N66_22290 [Pantoea allii]
MIAVGTLVRRRKRRKTMVVLECTDDIILCGWIENGRFFKRRFNLAELNICVPYASIWSLT